MTDKNINLYQRLIRKNYIRKDELRIETLHDYFPRELLNLIEDFIDYH